VRWGIGFAALAVVLGLVVPGSAAAFGPLSSFGAYGAGPGEFEPEGGIAIGASSDTYVADYGNGRVDQFAPDGSFVRSFGELSEPEGIAVAENGDVYVADQGVDRIFVFTAEGALLDEFGGEGEGAGEMTDPSGLAFDPASGDLFVADRENNRIDVFTAEGEFVRAFGREVAVIGGGDVCDEATECRAATHGGEAGGIYRPYGLALPPGGGNVYVADYYHERIDVFTPEGEFLFAFGDEVKFGGGGDYCDVETGCKTGGEDESAGSVSAPLWTTFDAAGDLHIGSAANRRIDVFTAAGAFVHAYGQGVVDGEAEFQICVVTCRAGSVDPTPGSGSIARPEGLATDCGGSVAVLEVEHDPPEAERFARIERFGEADAPAPPCEEAEIAVVHPIRRPPPPSPLVLPPNRFKFGRVKLNRRRGTGVLFVKVPGPGRLLLRGGGVRWVRRHAGRGGIVRMPVVPIDRAKRHLRRHHRVKLRIKVTFTPTGGRPFTKSKKIHLKRHHG
jgi:DNA-binding beta-propeller fold protein YncE